MTRCDLSPIIARVIVENPPLGMGTLGLISWVKRTWPGCTDEEVTRAFLIADEIERADTLAAGV